MPESKRRKPKKPQRARPQTVTATAKTAAPSPTWYVALMAGLMVVGVIVVIARFVFQLDNWVTVGGLAMIAAGFLMTTNYR